MMRLKLKIGRSLYGAGYGIISPGGGAAWSPSSLFASGEQGVWYDPSDFSTMFQDSIGTTPVTAVGQPVGKILDKSGRGNHASQSTAAARPVLQQDGNGKYYLAFDAEGNKLLSTSIDFSGTNEATIAVAFSRTNDATAGYIFSHSADINTQPGVSMSSPTFAAASIGLVSVGTSLTLALQNPAQAAGIPVVALGQTKISTDKNILQVNGTQVASSAADQGSGNYQNVAAHIGSVQGGGAYFNGKLYGIVYLSRNETAQEQSDTNQYLASKAGVTL